MTVSHAKLVGLTTLELEHENWKAKNAKGEWHSTDKKAIVIRRKLGRSLHEIKFDIDEIAPLVELLQTVNQK